MTNSIAQAVVKRDRLVVIAGLAAVTFAAAIYTVTMAKQISQPMDFALMPTAHSSTPGARGFLILFAMWSVMQVAMMSPTAVPHPK